MGRGIRKHRRLIASAVAVILALILLLSVALPFMSIL
jgi:hypothetical protein